MINPSSKNLYYFDNEFLRLACSLAIQSGNCLLLFISGKTSARTMFSTSMSIPQNATALPSTLLNSSSWSSWLLRNDNYYAALKLNFSNLVARLPWHLLVLMASLEIRMMFWHGWKWGRLGIVLEANCDKFLNMKF